MEEEEEEEEEWWLDLTSFIFSIAEF